MATSLEHYMSYNSLPLSRRIEKNIQSEKRNVNYELRGRDVNWRSGINTLDPETGLSPLMVAILQGKKDLVIALIERGANVEAVDSKKGRTPLQIAAKEGQYEILKELMKRDGIINSSDHHQKTALMHAAKGGYLDCVNALLNRGAGVNMIDDHGFTALHYATKFGHHLIVTELLKATASIESRDNLDGYAALHFAAQYGRKECLLVLLEYGARMNRRSIKEKLTPLMLASREGNKTIVSILLAKGAEVNNVDIHGWTALHFASSWGRRDTAHMLIVDGNANVNAKDPTRDGIGGTTPLIVAAKGAQILVMKLLIAYGADLNDHEDHFGQNALIAAAELGHTNVLQCLLDYHAEINFQNPFTGMTALMTAAAKGQRGAMILLLNHYADMNIIDLKYLTAFEHANKNKTRDILLSAIVHITPAAKTNLLPWLEVHCPLLVRQSTYGGPAVFLNSFLHGNKGCYYGLYNATRDRDVYLIYSLTMILNACRRSIEYHPRDTPDLLIKIQQIEEMIIQCIQARDLADDYLFTDCFVLGAYPAQQLQEPRQIMKYFMSAFFFGPLALYLENTKGMKVLATKHIRDKIDVVFRTTLKPSNLLVDGYGKKSFFLLWRYNPALLFLLEGVGQVILLGMILSFAINSHPSSNYYSKSANGNNTNSLDHSEIFLMIMIGGFVAYQIGLLEEKRWMISPSIIFDFPMLEQLRYQKLQLHFFENPWNFLDGITMILTLLWLIIRLIALFIYSSSSSSAAYYIGISGEILLLALVPIAIGLIRYLSLFHLSLDIEILTIFTIFLDLLMYVIIFIIVLLAFGVVYYAVYHQEIDSFGTYATSVRTLFNGILLNYDSTLFDHSRNTDYGIVISGIFFIFTVFILFNGIIGNIAANYHSNRIHAEEWSAQIKSKMIQRYGLILEKSGLCMLPPPFNALLVLIYPCHVYYIWRSRLAKQQRTAVSIAGTVSDYLLGFVFLLPSAIYEYMMVDVLNSDKGLMFSVLYAPIGIVYIICCLFYKLYTEPVVEVILKSRISDGRLKITYSTKRDEYEEQTLSQFEDNRIFKDLQAFNSPIFSPIASPREDLYSVISEDSLSKMTPNQLPKNPPNADVSNTKTPDNNPENTPSFFTVLRKQLFQKRQTDFIGRNVRIAPNNPFLQLNNVSELKETLTGVTQKKPKTLVEHEMIMKIIEQKKEDEKKKQKTIWLAHEIHSEYHASMAPNVTEVESIIQQNDEKPPLFWMTADGGGERKGGTVGGVGERERPPTAKINPYQPGIFTKAQWEELAGETEPKDNTIALTRSPTRPSTAVDPSQALGKASSTSPPPGTPVLPQTITNNNTRPSSPQQILNESMISPMKKQFLSPSKQQTILNKSTYFHHQDNYHLIDEQAIDHYLQLNSPSFYFQLSKFPSIYTEQERKTIFQNVLKELFLDDFAYQLENNEKYLIELKMTIASLRKLNLSQNEMMKGFIKKIEELEGKGGVGDGTKSLFSRPVTAMEGGGAAVGELQLNEIYQQSQYPTHHYDNSDPSTRQQVYYEDQHQYYDHNQYEDSGYYYHTQEYEEPPQQPQVLRIWENSDS